MEKKDFWLIIGALNGLIAVIMGPVGAHILESIITEADFSAYQKAVRYQMWHAFGLILISLLSAQTTTRMKNIAGWSFLIGIILFSGSLYLIGFTSVREIGIIAPFGGTAFIIGWFFLMYSGFKER